MDGGLVTAPLDNVSRETLTMAILLDAVAAEFDLPVETLRGRSRCAVFVRPRQAFYWLAARAGFWSYPSIGRFIGRDHASVFYGVQRADIWIERDERYRVKLMALRDRFGLHRPHPTKRICPHCGGEVN